MGVTCLLFTMNILIHLTIVLTISSYLVLANESFHGSGTFACYGDMSITFDKSSSGGEGEGLVDCQPSWGSAAAPPQGIIADGEDGSHRMTVDDGHQTRLFCGYATCTGYLNIECSMLSG